MSQWPMVPLGEILQEQRRRIGTIDADNLHLLGVSNAEGLHRSGMSRISDMSRYFRVEQGWFAYNPMRINVGSIGWAKEENQTGVISPDYVVFSCNERVRPELVYWFLKHRRGLQAINAVTAGSVRERLYYDTLARIEFPLPPLSEQRRLVERIDNLADKISEAQGLRQGADEQSSLLLGQAVKQLFEKGKAAGWRNGKMGDIITEASYGTSEKTSDDESGVPILRMGNIQAGRLRLSDLKYLHLSILDRGKYILKRGDILVNRTNSAELVGKCAVFEQEGDFGYASYIIRLRVDEKLANPSLVAHFINSPFGRAYMLSEKKQMTGQANVNTAKLRAMPIVLPDRHEQDSVLGHIEKIRTLRYDSLREQELTSLELNAMLPAILDRAFRGEL